MTDLDLSTRVYQLGANQSITKELIRPCVRKFVIYAFIIYIFQKYGSSVMYLKSVYRKAILFLKLHIDEGRIREPKVDSVVSFGWKFSLVFYNFKHMQVSFTDRMKCLKC